MNEDQKKQEGIEKEERMKIRARLKAEEDFKKEKKKEKNKNAGIGCLVLLAIIVIFVVFTNTESNSEQPVFTKAEQRIEMIEDQFSSWDGSHSELTKVIKKSMNDPKSYDHVETVYFDMGDHLIVNTTFRGENAFGGIVKNTIKAKISIDGENIEILEQY